MASQLGGRTRQSNRDADKFASPRQQLARKRGARLTFEWNLMAAFGLSRSRLAVNGASGGHSATHTSDGHDRRPWWLRRSIKCVGLRHDNLGHNNNIERCNNLPPAPQAVQPRAIRRTEPISKQIDVQISRLSPISSLALF